MVLALDGKHALIADDDTFALEGIIKIVHEAGMSATGCGNAVHLHDILLSHHTLFDVVILDIYDMGYIKAQTNITLEEHIPKLVEHYPDLPIVILSSDDILARQFLKYDGVRGYVLKKDGRTALISILIDVLVNGHTRCSPSVRMKRRLTPRDLEVLTLKAQGYKSEDIGQKLCLALTTIHTYLAKIRTKLDAQNMDHAIALAIQERIIRIPRPPRDQEE